MAAFEVAPNSFGLDLYKILYFIYKLGHHEHMILSCALVIESVLLLRCGNSLSESYEEQTTIKETEIGGQIN